MANTSSVTILADGPRNAVVRVIGTLDTTDLTLSGAIALSSFIGNSERNGALAGFDVDEIQYSVTSPLTVFVEWDSATPQPVAAVSGAGKLCFRSVGGAHPVRTAAGYTGNMTVRTVGYVPGSTVAFSLLLRMVKQF